MSRYAVSANAESERAANLLRHLEHLIREEAQIQHDRFNSQWTRPIAERVRNGKALEGLSVISVNPATGRIALQCDRNDAGFREGDHLFLHRGDACAKGRIEAVLEYDEETTLEVSPRAGPIQQLSEIRDDWIADEGYFDLSGFFLDALGEVADRQTGRQIILPLILGGLTPRLDMAAYERGWLASVDAGLNTRQAEAAASAYATDVAHLIQGPPGTGKTFVLAHIARMLAGEGARVLITALTHRAINNALNTIVGQADLTTPVCKIGHPSRGDDLRVDNYETFRQSSLDSQHNGYIVGATPFATRTARLAEVEFDTVIFDEASQITLPLAILGMLAGRSYIFVGDDCQLPPVTTLTRDSELAHTSIFGYLGSRGYNTMLDVTYRLNDALTAWPSRVFYADELRPAEGIGTRRLNLDATDQRWARALDPNEPLVFIDIFGSNTTLRSRREADIVIDLIRALLQAGVPPHDIGVITPYRAQGREIRNLLRRTLPATEPRRQIIIDTVERMQGQEREVVLVSLATASAGFAASLAHFFFQPQRLNVTITRPRTKLIIVGSSGVLRARPDDPKLVADVELFRDLIRHCTTVPLAPDDGADAYDTRARDATEQTQARNEPF